MIKQWLISLYLKIVQINKNTNNMKKTYKNLLFGTVAWLGATSVAHAQLPVATSYTFSSFAGTYAPLSGTSGTVIGDQFSDDQYVVDPSDPTGNNFNNQGPGFGIGFNFWYAGSNFDRIAVGINGWIALGQSATTPAVDVSFGTSYPISTWYNTNTVQDQRISIFGRDLQGQSGSEIRIETIGTAPNRVCVIQWQGYRRYNASGDNMNFQIRLHETSNIIQFVYGVFTLSGGTYAELGLRGIPNPATDFNNRLTNTSWAASTAGTNSWDQVYASNTNFPANGQVYQWDPPPPCSGTPANTPIAATFTMICPVGTNTINFSVPYTAPGISYQWQSATLSNVGPFTNISGATGAGLNPVNQNVVTYYRAIVSCASAPTSYTTAVVTVSVAATTTSVVPYFEGFEGMESGLNLLPNCSWARTNPQECVTSTLTQYGYVPRTGNGFAVFDYNNNPNNNNNFFWTEGIQLNAGVTYSATVWYRCSWTNSFSDVTLYFNGSQSPTGATQIATATNPSNTTYKALTNTFQVATSGIYYIGVRGKNNFNWEYVAFDDLEITAPCTFTNNAVNLAVNAPASICFGKTANLVASGANTYTWSTGPNSSSIAVTPSLNTTYYVAGTNTLSNCQLQISMPIIVNPMPGVQIYAPKTDVCDGQSINLFASGSANTYTWSDGTNTATTPMYVVTPTASTTYSVKGSNSFGCTTEVSQLVTFNPLPQVSASVPGNTVICKGEPANLTGMGASTYIWTSNNVYLVGTNVSTYPNIGTTNYTVTGTDANGCENTSVITMKVDACTGIASINGSIAGLNVYPNPSNGEFTVELNNGLNKSVQVIDVTGRTVLSTSSDNNQVKVNISNLANGVYYVKVKSDNATEVLKVVKQ